MLRHSLLNHNSNSFVEKAPAAIEHKLQEHVMVGERVVIQVTIDMVGWRAFDEAWFIVTDRRIIFLRNKGRDLFVDLSLSSVRTVRVEELVGGGRLEVERTNGDTECFYYSNSLAAKFSDVAESIRQLIDNKDVSLPANLERDRCKKCKRLLPEKNGICPACVKKIDTLLRLIRYMMVYKARIAALLLMLSVQALIDLVPPLIIERIIDDVLTDVIVVEPANTVKSTPTISSSKLTLLAWLVTGLLMVYIVSWIALVTQRWVGSWVGFRAIEYLRADLFRALQYLPLRFYDQRKVGSLISRMSNDADLVEVHLLFDIPYLLNNALMVLGILGLLFYKNWELTLWVLIPIPPIVVFSTLIWGSMEAHWRRWSAHWGRLSSHLNESIRGIRIVKAFAQESREGERFDNRNNDLSAASVSAERIWVVFFMITNFFMSFGVFFVWYFGGRQILGGELELGALIAFITYLWMLYKPLKWFGDFYGMMMRAYAGAERIFEVIDTRSEPFNDPKANSALAIKGHVSFEDLSFGYDVGKPVLQNIDLTVAPGEMIGLVGKSGAGKSTLINMICRFYDGTRGTLKIDGIDIRKIKIQDLRRQIGLVAQQSFLFNSTIADNISYGKPGTKFEDIIRASRAANAHEFVVTKSEGYDMVVGEHGNKLSGGEKQRIAIARAILHNPRILILDEATSSLDSQTESKIQEAIARLVKGRTTFAIAHRLSTLRSADRLVVLDGGKVVEVGSHIELMERKGVFHNLVKTQQETTAIMATAG